VTHLVRGGPSSGLAGLGLTGLSGGTPISSEQQHDERDRDPGPPEDEECFDAPDAASMEEAFSKFVEGLESQDFARGKPRLGGLSVEKTFERQVAAGEASKERAAENRRRCKADKAWFKVKEVFYSICPEYILVYKQYIQLHPWDIPLYTHYSQVTVWKAIYQILTPENHDMCLGCASN
jgi:hypothetical protein